MKRFVAGADRGQSTLLPECLDDWVDESNPVRVIDAFVDALDLADLGFEGVEPAATGRPAYHPSVLLKLYIYGYLNRVQSSRRLEREAGRNVEVMWLLGRLAPDDKTIADFRKDNGPAIRKVCARFVELCREMGLLAKASVAIDGSKFKAVNNRDKNFTRGEGGAAARAARGERGALSAPARHGRPAGADRRRSCVKTTRLKEKLAKLDEEMEQARGLREADAGLARSADLAHRSRQPLDGDERARLGRRRLQRAGRGRHRAPSDHRARGDEYRLGSLTTCEHGASRPRRCCKSRSSKPSPIAATSTARRSWRATRPASR